MRPPFVFLVPLLALAGCGSQSAPDKENAVLVSFASYRAVRPGMTLQQVEDLLHATGYAIRDGNDVERYVWRNGFSGSSGMSARFVKGKLVEKRSIGNLR